MCNVCCHEFGGWCKAFTKTERLLTIIECILLVFFFIFLTFLILHLLVCPKVEYPTTTDEGSSSTSDPNEFSTVGPGPSRQTLGPHVKCTWEPSKKTKATTHYYEFDRLMKPLTTQTMAQLNTLENETDFDSSTLAPSAVPLAEDENEDWAGVEESDGEAPEPGFEKLVIALVKIKPMRDITFGCILTIVSDHWTLTAASCIDAIEEVDSLDSFVMMEGYGAGAGGRTHAVDGVRVHPLYGGANRSYDVAALRSEDRLPPARARPRLPDALDPLLLTVGERVLILGYGAFRSVQTRASDRSVREVHVYKLPQQACGAERAAGELRHLTRPEAAAQGACGAEALCAGPLHARGVPCNYCAGTPLLVDGRLLGLMADNQQCGVACEPAQYVNLATLRDWLDAVLSDRSD